MWPSQEKDDLVYILPYFSISRPDANADYIISNLQTL